MRSISGESRSILLFVYLESLRLLSRSLLYHSFFGGFVSGTACTSIRRYVSLCSEVLILHVYGYYLALDITYLDRSPRK